MKAIDYYPAALVLMISLLHCVALTGCTKSSRNANDPAIIKNATDQVMAEDKIISLQCGAKDDGLPHIPPSFNTFVPPGQGNSYSDPQYGCTITRLTNSKSEFNLAVHHQYATISAMNQNDTRIMLITEWGQGVIVDTAGHIVVGPHDFPAINSGNVPWARDSADVFYYTNKNTLYQGKISGSTVNSTALHTFAGYSNVMIPDQEDLSEDGDHLWIVSGTHAFLYSISTGATGVAVNVGMKETDCGWHKIQITPSNKMLITWTCNGAAAGQGQEIYSTDGTLYWHMFNSSLHTDVGKDLTGNEVAVVGRIPDTYRDACPSGGGADTIRVDSPHIVSCLVDINWASAHISYRDSSQGWVAISFFDQGTCPHYSCFDPQHLAPDWQSSWRHFYEELVFVKIDGSAVFRLAHHRSRSAESYWAESRAAISRDGRYVVFDSNMNIGNTGLSDYADVYLIKVQ
jgi:hypothetical protein